MGMGPGDAAKVRFEVKPNVVRYSDTENIYNALQRNCAIKTIKAKTHILLDKNGTEQTWLLSGSSHTV